MLTKTKVQALYVVSITFGLALFVVQVLSIALTSKDSPRDSWGRSKSRMGVSSVTIITAALSTIYLLRKALNDWILRRWPDLPKLLPWYVKITDLWVPIALTILNIFSVIASFFTVLNVGYFVWVASESFEDGTTQKAMDAAGLGISVVFTSLVIIAMWWPRIMFTDCLIGVASALQIIISIVSMLINTALEETSAHLTVKSIQIYIALSLFLACTGFTGFGMIVVVRSYNRLSTPTSRLALFYVGTAVLNLILCITWFSISLAQLLHTVNEQAYVQALLANPILAFCAFFINIAGVWCAFRLMKPPHTNLRVEVYDLANCTPRQIEVWGKIIDAYNRKGNSDDVAQGANALDLMKAYVESPMHGFNCRVLRVFDQKVADTEKQAQERSYDQVRAWGDMDDVSIFGSAEFDINSIATTISGEAHEEKKMSKNAAKRAQKKAAKKNKQLTVPDFNEKSLEEIEEEQQFFACVKATEALVLLTTINNYDLTSAIKGKFGRILQRTLGGESWSKLLCVNFGILGTHWPFRQAVYYTAPTRKPTARSAAVLSAISQWNDNQRCADRCSIIYNPSYGMSHNETALQVSGWQAAPAMPSHVVDLRPYKGKTVKEYLKIIKYRNQATAFEKDKGQVIETTEFSPYNCGVAMDLWHNIAEKRVAEGHTAVLKEPTEAFIESLGSPEHNTKGWRKLLFLKVNDEIIASCVLFFLGNTLTSDIQGLEHEKARHYKAYFVMMQETLAIALRDGISFVDFGPTTAKPKLDIGCSSVPLIGGVKAKQPLGMMVGIFSKQVDV